MIKIQQKIGFNLKNLISSLNNYLDYFTQLHPFFKKIDASNVMSLTLKNQNSPQNQTTKIGRFRATWNDSQPKKNAEERQ